MSGADVAFWLLSAAAVVTGWRVFRTDSMVRATFFLLASFIAVGAIMLMLSAPYLGFATMFMMTVEMMVMAVFMVMFMMNPAGLNPMNMVHQHTAAVVAGSATFAGLATLALVTRFPSRPVDAAADVVARLGHELLGESMLVFETAGVTLLATMVCAVVLTCRTGRYGLGDEGAEPPPIDAAAGDAGAEERA